METIQNVLRQGVYFSKYAAVMSDHSSANTTEKYAFIPTTR